MYELYRIVLIVHSSPVWPPGFLELLQTICGGFDHLDQSHYLHPQLRAVCVTLTIGGPSRLVGCRRCVHGWCVGQRSNNVTIIVNLSQHHRLL